MVPGRERDIFFLENNTACLKHLKGNETIILDPGLRES